jgi:nucleoside-diphosphate-sugar epimerase
MKIGILGAHGFIGSYIFESLKLIHNCEVFDHNKYNLLSVNSMEPFVCDKDLIIHLAGSNRASNDELFMVNTSGTINLLEAIRKYSNNNTKIIFSSSMQVYGLSSDFKLYNEEDIPQPINMYGLSKLFAEESIRKYNEWYGLKGLILRMANVYGPGCKPYYNSVISSFIDLIKKGEKITINGTGEQSRDFIFISDIVEAFSKSLYYDSKSIETINICTGKSISINQVLKALNELMDNSPRIEHIESNEPINYLIGDPVKASKILNFKPVVDLNNGLIKTIL